MKILNVFEASTTAHFLERLEKLGPESQPQWGKMNAGQMLAHVNVAYGIDNGTVKSNPGAFGRLMIKLFVRKMVLSDKPYKHNLRTSPDFLITDERVFNDEKTQLIEHIEATQAKGPGHYEGRSNPGFGVMTAKEWNNLFSKHLDHHLKQFGV